MGNIPSRGLIGTSVSLTNVEAGQTYGETGTAPNFFEELPDELLVKVLIWVSRFDLKSARLASQASSRLRAVAMNTPGDPSVHPDGVFFAGKPSIHRLSLLASSGFQRDLHSLHSLQHCMTPLDKMPDKCRKVLNLREQIKQVAKCGRSTLHTFPGFRKQKIIPMFGCPEEYGNVFMYDYCILGQLLQSAGYDYEKTPDMPIEEIDCLIEKYVKSQEFLESTKENAENRAADVLRMCRGKNGPVYPMANLNIRFVAIINGGTFYVYGGLDPDKPLLP